MATSRLRTNPVPTRSYAPCGAVFENPKLREVPDEEVARQLVLGVHVRVEPSPVLVAEMLEALEAEEQGFEADEPSEEGNPT